MYHEFSYTVYCRYFDKNGTEHQKPIKSFIFPLFVVFCESKSSETYRIAITDSSNSKVLEQFQKVVTRRNGTRDGWFTRHVSSVQIVLLTS